MASKPSQEAVTWRGSQRKRATVGPAGGKCQESRGKDVGKENE
eukprot:CAMPEP_0194764278 /NCGR_PEP_ID=MMETSP0323_2-20130528/22016_1 /TAXON_ID=2866 ORGANISM="Crypthecodinium cohnii, Strain Seligo" /NCGR_SAMPLE_ID=MMETSP0323_2 /ASSEMBLY_ACC=CAM_ASM_000346 /LENGTH=42 /DNA_ID= /DNA_START= /DNA_END= /DNA_ORIENTATION=